MSNNPSYTSLIAFAAPKPSSGSEIRPSFSYPIMQEKNESAEAFYIRVNARLKIQDTTSEMHIYELVTVKKATRTIEDVQIPSARTHTIVEIKPDEKAPIAEI